MTFPAPPYTTGQVHVSGGISYTYNGTIWARTPVAAPADNYTNGASFDAASRQLTLTQAVASTPAVNVTIPDTKVSGLTFSSANRTVTLTQNDATTFSAVVPETNTTLVYDAALKKLTYTGESGIAQVVDLSALAVDIFVNGGTFNATTAVLTLTDNDGTTPNVVVDLSSLKSALVNNNDGTWTHTVGGVSVIIDTRSIKEFTTLPASPYDGQIIYTSGGLYKWMANPGLWLQAL